MRFNETLTVSPDYHQYVNSLGYIELEKAKSARRLGEAIVEKIGWTKIPDDGKRFEINIDVFDSERFEKFLRDVSSHVDGMIINGLISELCKPYNHQK